MILRPGVYEDTQDEVYRHLSYMDRRGVEPGFAIEMIRNQRDELWYPSRAELQAAGVLRDR